MRRRRQHRNLRVVAACKTRSRQYVGGVPYPAIALSICTVCEDATNMQQSNMQRYRQKVASAVAPCISARLNRCPVSVQLAIFAVNLALAGLTANSQCNWHLQDDGACPFVPACRPAGSPRPCIAVRLRRAISAIHANLRERPFRAHSDRRSGSATDRWHLHRRHSRMISIRHCDGPRRGH
jgi:hypothetical protein